VTKIIDNFIDREIGRILLEENAKEEAEHVSSGKLSASRLNDPLQCQVLYALGVKKAPFDEYAIRKFKRGNHVEAWIKQFLGNDLQSQKKLEYRNVVGRLDALVDTAKWDFPHDIVPVEIKSVANAKFKRILANGPDRGHIYQAVHYGIASGVDYVAVLYVASDDYRVQTYWIRVSDYKKEVDKIINDFDLAMATKTIPDFIAREKWQENPKYNPYFEWKDKSRKELNLLAKELFKKYDKQTSR